MQYMPLPHVIWTDDKFVMMSPEQRAIFIYLYTNQMSSHCGMYKLQIRTMAFNLGIMVDGPIDSALKAVYALYPELVAYDPDTEEVALLKYPRHLHLEASKAVLLAAEKQLSKIESAFLLRKMIESNSATLGKMYVRRLQKIVSGDGGSQKSESDEKNTQKSDTTDNEDVNLQLNETKLNESKLNVQGSNFSSFEDEEETENENQAPQVKAQVLEHDSAAAPPLSVESTPSQGLKETKYKQALMTLLKKFAREYWDRPDIDTFLEYCWVEGKEFKIKKYGMKKTVPGLLELLKTHFEGEIGEMNKKKAEVAADHSEIEGLVEKTIEYCNKWWKDQWRTYPELMAIRKSYDKERAAIKKLLMRNKKKEVSLIMFVYWKEPMVMNSRMNSDWVSIEANFKNVLEIAEEMYNDHKSWEIPGWPKQQQ